MNGLVLWLGGLGILWGVLLFGGFALGDRRNPAADRRIPTWARMGSSAALVMAAWSWAAVVWGGPAQAYALWIALGMTLGFVGDLALADQLPETEHRAGAHRHGGLWPGPCGLHHRYAGVDWWGYRAHVSRFSLG